MQAKVDKLEDEKQALQLKIIKLTDQFEKGDQSFKERQETYEGMLSESKRAYN